MAEPTEAPIDASWEEMVEARNRPRTPQHALRMAVRAGEMTPKQAEDKCLADGLSLWHQGWQELRDITTNSIWWLPQAVLFYAWQDLGHTREQWERFSFWEDDLWRDPTDERQLFSLEEAETLFRSDLRSGVVRAFGASGDGPVRPIPCEFWETSGVQRWRGSAAIGEDGVSRFVGAFVLRHEVVPLLISEHANDGSAMAPEYRDRPDQPQKRGGRVLAEQWHDMWAEVCRIVHEEGLPADRLTLVKRMQQWFTDQGHEAPAPQKLNPVLDRLFKILGR